MLRHQVIPYFKHGPRSLFQREQLQKAANITPTIKSTIQAVAKIVTCRSFGY